MAEIIINNYIAKIKVLPKIKQNYIFKLVDEYSQKYFTPTKEENLEIINSQQSSCIKAKDMNLILDSFGLKSRYVDKV